MKKLYLIVVSLVLMTITQAQTVAIFDIAPRTNITIHNWTDLSSTCESMTIGTLPVEFVAKKARVSHSVNVTNHIVRSSHVSPEGKIIKGVLHNEKGDIIGTARFSIVGTSMAGTADIGNDTYKFRPDKDGNYYWELEAPFVCGTDDVDHNGLPNPTHQHTAECHHNDDHSIASPSSMRDCQGCITESIQDVAFVTDDLMDEYGDDLDAILAQIAISDSWAEDVMTDSGFPDIAFFQESVNVVEFAESGTTWGNSQVFSDSLYAGPPGIIAGIIQNATSTVTVLYSLGGGGYAGVAVISVYPMPSGSYYESVLGNNGGLGNRIKTHEYGHSLWGGEHEDITPNPVLYRRAYLGYDVTFSENYVTTMGQSNFGGGSRVHRFSDSDPTAGWYDEDLEHTFSPVGNADRDMCRRITEEWDRDGIVQTVDITPATPTISADGPTDFCEGDSVELSVDTPESGVDYIWTNGETGNSITVLTVGTYSCYGEASASCSGASSNEIIVTVNALPTPTVTGDDNVCYQNDGTYSTEDASSYAWSIDPADAGTITSGQGTSSIVVEWNDSGDVNVDVTNANGCEGSSVPFSVTVNALPTPTISGDDEVCDGNDGTYSTESSSSYTWSIDPTNAGTIISGQGTSSIVVEWNDSGDVNVDVTNANGCEGSSVPFSVTVNALPDPSITGDTPVCEDSEGIYTTETADSYSWSIDPSSAGTILSGQGTSELNVEWYASGDVNVTVTNTNGCEGSTSFAVTVNDKPIANAGDDQSIPYGTSTTLDGSATGGDGTYTYSWTPADMVIDPSDPQTATVPFEAPQTLTLEVTDGNGCISNLDDVFIDVTGGPLGLDPDVDPDATYGDTQVQLSANAYGGTESYTYSWTSDPVGFTSTEENPVDTPTATTIYICEVDDGNNTETAEVTVTVYDQLVVDAGPDMGLELEQTVQLEGSYTGGSGDMSILWTGVDNSIPISDPFILNPIAGPFFEIDVYYFVLTTTDNLLGISISDTMFVDVIEDVETFSTDDINIYPNPTLGNLFIQAQVKPEIVSIINIDGSEVLRIENISKMNKIDLSSIPSGVYFIRITFKNQTVIKKIVKK